MPDDLQQLQHLQELQQKIEEGLAAAKELKQLAAEEKCQNRPKLRLIKGGLTWGAIWAGVEWFRNYRRGVAALTLSGLTMGGVFIAEHPNSPGSDPPESVKPPAAVKPSTEPTAKPTVTPRPPRTSPLRTLARNSTPVAAPGPTATPDKPAPSRTPTTPSPSIEPAETPDQAPLASLPPLPTKAMETPELATPAITCVINLLGIEVCLPRG